MEHPLDKLVDPTNVWRRESPGHSGWEGSPRPGDTDKYFMFSADTHIVEPSTLWRGRGRPPYPERLRPAKIALAEDAGPEDRYREQAAKTVADRLRDQAYDGIDKELIFPTKGMFGFATRDVDFAVAQCRIYNDWVRQELADHWERCL